MTKNLRHYPTKYNHYHLELRDERGFMLLETDIPFTQSKQLRDTCKAWATIRNAHSLLMWRGQRAVGYVNYNCHWELEYGPILKAAHQY